MDVKFGGAYELTNLARRLEKLAGQDLVVETLGKTVDGFYPEMVKAVEKGAERLPQRGGLAKRVARTKIIRKITVRSGFYSLKVSAASNAVADPAAIDRGRVKRPTFGHEPSVIQLVPKGWFTEPLKALSPRMHDAIQAALSDAIRKF